MFVFVMILCLFQLCESQDTSPIINLAQGDIVGTRKTSFAEPHSEYYSFLGIPYAAPPVGVLRFQAPQEPESWTDVKMAVEFGNQCPQLAAPYVVGDENCLFINVYTPNVTCSQFYPVLFYIHGGAFVSGSSNIFGPDYLINENIILVTFNYRLGILGYLSVQDENSHGNFALLDKIAALHWVRRNIERFCGDPEKITIMGHSSGAYSAEYLQVSPLAKGLFQHIIVMSGSVLNHRSLQREPMKYVKRLVSYLGIDNSTTKSIVEGFRSIPYEVLIRESQNPEATGYVPSLHSQPFIPVIEVDHPDAVITKRSYELLENGNYNHMKFMHGHTSSDGSLGFETVDAEDYDKNPALYTPISLNLEPSMEIGGEIRDFFMANSSAKDAVKFMKYLTHELVVRGIRKSLDFKRHSNEGYYYTFSYKGTLSSPAMPGVPHGEDAIYLFFVSQDLELSETDRFISKIYTRFIANFVKNGTPNDPFDQLLGKIHWPEVNATSIGWINIDSQLWTDYSPESWEHLFWWHIFTYADTPLYTY